MQVCCPVSRADLDRFAQLTVKKGIPWKRLRQNQEDAICVVRIAALFCPDTSLAEIDWFLSGPACWLHIDAKELQQELTTYLSSVDPAVSCGNGLTRDEVRSALSRFHAQRMATQQAIRQKLQEKNLRLHAKHRSLTTTSEKQDEKWMKLALERARRALAAGEVPVGAVLVHNGEILSLAENRVCRDKDPTAHAEILAIREACKKMGSERIPHTLLYVTLEPCPMCAAAIAAARLDKVVWGANNPTCGAMGGTIDIARSAHLNHYAGKKSGVLGNESKDLLLAFFRGKRKKL